MTNLSRPDFTKDCEPIFRNIGSLVDELKAFEEGWLYYKCQLRDLYPLICADDFNGSDRTTFERLDTEGRTFSMTTQYSCKAINDGLRCPDLKTYLDQELNSVIEEIISQKRLLQLAEKTYKKYVTHKNLAVIQDMILHFKEQLSLVERVVPAFIAQLKRTEQYTIENNLRNDIQSSSTLSHSPITNYGNLTVTIGNSNSVNIKIKQNDQSAFCRALLDAGLDQDSISELLAVVENERTNVKDTSLSPTLNKAMHKVIEKTIDGTWSIPFGVASSFLFEIINKYYGFFP